MIRAALVHDGGIIMALGIVEANIARLKEGRPIAVDLGQMLKMMSSEDFQERGTLSLMISYGDSHVEIIDRWNEELTSSGLSLDDRYLEQAAQLDEQMRSEGLM